MPKSKGRDNKVHQLSRDEARSTVSRKRNRRRKRVRLILYSVLFLCVIAAAVALSLTVFFNIGVIQTVGSQLYSETDITDASGVTVGENLFLTDTDSVAKKIEGTLPYAGEVTVKRKLPGTLVIEVVDTSACAAFDGVQGYILINENGKVLSNDSMLYGDAASYITGVTITSAEVCSIVQFENEDTFGLLSELLTAVKKAELKHITQINVSDAGSLTMIYDSRITLRIGSLVNLDSKLFRAKEALTAEDERNPAATGTLDLTIDPYAYFREAKATTEPPTETPAQSEPVPAEGQMNE